MTTTLERTQYLRRCAMVSLRKRWYYALLVAALAGGTIFALDNALAVAVLGGLVAALACLAFIALNSMRRHANEVPNTF